MNTKRSRIVLTAIAVLAIAGGTLAFKAQRQPQLFYRPAAPGGVCSIATSLNYTTVPEGTPGAITTQLSVASTTTSCSTFVVQND